MLMNPLLYFSLGIFRSRSFMDYNKPFLSLLFKCNIMFYSSALKKMQQIATVYLSFLNIYQSIY